MAKIKLTKTAVDAAILGTTTMNSGIRPYPDSC
jgi:hypothetical protein